VNEDQKLSAIEREFIGEFPVQDSNGRRVLASLYKGLSDRNFKDLESKWTPSFRERRAKADSMGRTDWRDPHSHWEWERKAENRKEDLDRPMFALEIGNVTEGLLVLDLGQFHTYRGVEFKGKSLVYVEYVCTAPWNVPHPDGRTIQFHGIGGVLMLAAVEISVNEEYDGRLGLHSVKDAEGFYRVWCGMTDMGNDKGHEGLRYFEMSPEQAASFRKKLAAGSKEVQ